VTLEALREALLSDYLVNERKGAARATAAFAHIFGYFGQHAKAGDLTPETLAAYCASRMETAARGTVWYEITVLKRAFHLMAEYGRVIPPKFPKIRPSPPRQGFFEADQVEAVIANLPLELRGFVQFLYLTGWRASEAQGLKWTAVDWQAGIVRLEVGTTKNEDGRVFPFGALPQLEECLRYQMDIVTMFERGLRKRIPWVFARIGGGRILDYWKAWHGACRRAGVPGRLVHDLRRTAVRNLERAGVPRPIAKKITGHRTDQIYERYCIVDERDMAEGVGKLADFLAGGSDKARQYLNLKNRGISS
jgi:integrase